MVIFLVPSYMLRVALCVRALWSSALLAWINMTASSAVQKVLASSPAFTQRIDGGPRLSSGTHSFIRLLILCPRLCAGVMRRGGWGRRRGRWRTERRRWCWWGGLKRFFYLFFFGAHPRRNHKPRSPAPRNNQPALSGVTSLRRRRCNCTPHTDSVMISPAEPLQPAGVCSLCKIRSFKPLLLIHCALGAKHTKPLSVSTLPVKGFRTPQLFTSYPSISETSSH